jgi:hypothetical protein
MKIGVLKFTNIIRKRSTRQSGRRHHDENLGLYKILSELKRDYEFCSGSNIQEYDYVLASLCSFYDILNLIANVPVNRGKARVIIGGPGVNNIRPILDYIDIANFGRCDLGKINRIIEGEKLISVWRKSDDPDFEDEYEVDHSTRKGLGEFEKGLGCRKKCAFCFYSWWNGHIGNGDNYDDMGGNEDFITHADFSKHLVLTGLDGMTEATRYRVNKRISRSDIEQAILSLNNFDKKGKKTTVDLYSVIGFPWEGKHELRKCDMIPICEELDGKLKNHLIVNLRLRHFVPRQKTPLWASEFNWTDYRRLAKAQRMLFSGRKITLRIGEGCNSPISAAEETVWQRAMKKDADILKFFTTEKYKNLSYHQKISFFKTKCKKFLEKQEKENIDNIKI